LPAVLGDVKSARGGGAPIERENGDGFFFPLKKVACQSWENIFFFRAENKAAKTGMERETWLTSETKATQALRQNWENARWLSVQNNATRFPKRETSGCTCKRLCSGQNVNGGSLLIAWKTLAAWAFLQQSDCSGIRMRGFSLTTTRYLI